jgi:hypothetical protein
VASRLALIGFGVLRGCKSLTEFGIAGLVTEIHGSFLVIPGVHQVIADGFIVNRSGATVVCHFGDDCDARIGVNIDHLRQPSDFSHSAADDLVMLREEPRRAIRVSLPLLVDRVSHVPKNEIRRWVELRSRLRAREMNLSKPENDIIDGK